MDRNDARFVQFRDEIDKAVGDIQNAVNALVIQRDILRDEVNTLRTTLERSVARREKLEEALRVIRKPPFQWDSPESKDTEEVRFRIRVAEAALRDDD